MARIRAAKRLDAATWFQRGDASEVSAHLLFDKGQSLLFYAGTSVVVLRAFAVEAYLKCLVEMDGREPSWDHNFLDIFQQLRREDRVALRELWRQQYRHRIKEWNAQPGVPFKVKKTNLDGVLEECGDAFVLFRYGTEGGRVVPFMLFNFPLSIRDYILRLRPEFRPLRDPLPRNPDTDVTEAQHNGFGPLTTG